MTILQRLAAASCEGLPGEDAAERIAFPTRNGITATAVCSVTTSPPTMLVCINCGASAGSLTEASGAFAITFLTGSLRRPSSARRIGSQGEVAHPGNRIARPRRVGRQLRLPNRESDRCWSAPRLSWTETGRHQDVLAYRDGSFRRLASLG
ncbi:flavin reductase [Mesorhizobium albiziae]|uniref:flavin reductase n=1 Tax=Neomesorhizobium albiziae TaxID=335020 RepID=UPI00122D2F03